MNKIKYIILIFSLIISFTSCQKEAELTYANQEAKIDSYITSLMSSGEYELTRNGGSNRITTTKGSGEELREGGTISLYLAGYTFSNGFNKNGLFFTNSEEAATEAGQFHRRTLQRTHRSKGRRVLSDCIFCKIWLRHKEKWHDSCKNCPTLQSLGREYIK